MKNVIVILGCVLITVISYGQKHIATITGHLGGNEDNVGLYYRMTMGGKTIATNSISGGISIEVDVQNQEIEASADEIYIFLSWQGTFDGTGKPGSAEGTLKISSCYQASNLAIPLKDLGNGIGGYARLDINIRPEVKILPPDDNEYFLPLDQKVIIKAPEGFSSDVYNWEYKLEDSNWATIKTTHNGRYILGENENGASALDLFPSAQNFLGETVRFRIKYCGSSYAPEVIYRVVPSAPTIIATQVTNPDCIGDTGSIEFTFSRALYTSEKLSIISAHKDNGVVIYNESPTIEELTLTPNNTYTLTGITPQTQYDGKYRIKLLGFYDGHSTYSGSDAHFSIFSIENPTPVVFDPILPEHVTDLSCQNTKDGTITISASGGGGTYQYLIKKNSDPWGIVWNNFTAGNQSIITGLSADTYQIQIRDGKGCIALINGNPIIKEATIKSPIAIDAQVTDLKEPIANGSSDGSITAIIKGGTPYTNGTYTFKWINKNNPGQVFTTIETEVLPNNLGYVVRLHSIPSGMYALEISDKSNCSALIDNIFLDQPEMLEVALEITSTISCSGGSDGVLLATAKGGVPYTPNLDTNFLLYYYSWKKLENGVWVDLPQLENTKTISSLQAGTYAVFVKDKNNIEVMMPIDISSPEALHLEFETTIPLCHGGANGSAIVRVTGGTGKDTYTYEWKNSDGLVISEQATVTNLYAGNYTITVTDANGCTLEDIVDIIEPQILSVTFDTTRATCGGSNGSATTQVNGGTAGYTYLWNTGETTKKIEGLKADTYTVTVTDAKNCKITDTVVIQEPDPITIERIETTRTNCGGAIGTAEVVMSGDTAPYTYLWNTGATTQKIENLPYGEYTVIVKDKNNCIVEGSTIIQEPDPIVVERFETIPGTCDEPNGAAKVIMSGATGPYTYEWSTGAVTQEITNVRAGKYFVVVTDSNYCTTTGKVIIEEISGIEIDVISHVDPLCATSKDGSITVLPKGGTEPYTYMWTKKGTSEVIATSADIRGLPSGTYVVEINDAIGCTKVYEETLIAPEVVEVVLGNDLSICRGQSVVFDITIDDPNATYSWVSDTGYSSNTPTVELIDSGTYTATVTTGIGCIGTDEVVITVSDNPIDADFLYSTYSFSDQQVEVINTSNPIGERIEWVVSEGANIVEETKEKIILSFEESDIPKTYYTTLTSYNKNEECSISLTKPIIIEPGQGFSEDFGNEKFIEEFLIFPNASNGDFSIKVNLTEPSDIRVKIMNLISTIIDQQEAKGADDYEFKHSLSMAPGIYLVVLETSHGSETRKLVVE